MRFTYKKLIILLTLVLTILTGFLWYKEQSINKEAPIRAKFVMISEKRCNGYG
ncbi:MAG: hypothetical protein GX300_04360 [Tissierellia bacterium]|nr:hypothetical protein [Tissierellia bacterium]